MMDKKELDIMEMEMIAGGIETPHFGDPPGDPLFDPVDDPYNVLYYEYLEIMSNQKGDVKNDGQERT